MAIADTLDKVAEDDDRMGLGKDDKHADEYFETDDNDDHDHDY
jgi:hypothetical protein